MASCKLVTTLVDCYADVTGKDLELAYDPSVCDSNIVAVTLGIPVVTFGPSGENLHGDNECGYPEEVLASFEIYKQMVERLLAP